MTSTLSCLVFSVNLLYNDKAICMDGYSLSVQYKLHSDCFLIAANHGIFTWTPVFDTWKIVEQSSTPACVCGEAYTEWRKQGMFLFRPGGNSLRQLKNPGKTCSLAALLLSTLLSALLSPLASAPSAKIQRLRTAQRNTPASFVMRNTFFFSSFFCTYSLNSSYRP